MAWMDLQSPLPIVINQQFLLVSCVARLAHATYETHVASAMTK